MSEPHTWQAVFLDRDGTINEEKHFVCQAEDFALLPGVLEALKRVLAWGIPLYIVTNQSGIARGLYSEEQYLIFTRWMLGHLKGLGIDIAEVLYCPHHPHGSVPDFTRTCDCRKPGTGMIAAVIAREGFDPHRMALVGDKNSDIEAGRRLGMRTYLVETGYGAEHKKTSRADFVVTDLKAAVDHLLATGPLPYSWPPPKG